MLTPKSRRLADWSSDEDTSAIKSRKSKHDHVVILTNMFRPIDFEEDPGQLLEISQDVREACEDIGPTTKVTIYDLEPAGIVSVRFKSVEDAAACVPRMNGRWFAERQISAWIHDGKAKYRESKDRVPTTGELLEQMSSPPNNEEDANQTSS